MKKFLNLSTLCFTLSLIIFSNCTIVKAQDAKPETGSNLEQNNIDQSVEVFNHGQKKLYVTQSDIELMAKLIYAESRGEPYEGKVAVASVVLNRVLSPNFPSTVQEVIYQPKAFSCVKNGTIAAHPDKNCYDAAYEALRGHDPTNEALYFYNPSISTCSWMKHKEKKDAKSIGHHLFFKC
jgi:N-acetylmuramoyl-L-alanine amidase